METLVPVIENEESETKRTFKPLSLKIHTPAVVEEQPVELPFDNENQPKDSIIESLFLGVWESLSNKYKEESLSLYAALTTYKPSVTQTGTISLEVDNALQENLIQEKKQEILSFVRKELNNYFVTLETKIVEKQKRKKPLDPKEKLEKLNKKNNAVSKLCMSLDLDPFF